MKRSSVLKWLGAAALMALLFGAVWDIARKPSLKTESIRSSNSSPLFETHDKPMRIFLKAMDMENGRPTNITATIRQSKSRYNQMKQAVLAFLQGSRTGKFQALSLEGITLNEFYFTPLGTAVVDLSISQLKPSNFGFYEELLFIKGIVEVLSKNFFEVKQVKVLVDGKDAPTLVGHYALGTADMTAPVSVMSK